MGKSKTHPLVEYTPGWGSSAGMETIVRNPTDGIPSAHGKYFASEKTPRPDRGAYVQVIVHSAPRTNSAVVTKIRGVW